MCTAVLTVLARLSEVDPHSAVRLYDWYGTAIATAVVQVPPTIRYSRAKSGAADSDCGVKLGAENSLSGFNHCVSSSKTTVIRTGTDRVGLFQRDWLYST